MLRAKGDLSGAIEAASNTSDLLLRTNLLAEARRWSQAADFAEDLYRRNSGRLEAAGFAATYQRLAGNAGEHERVMKTLLKAANVERLKSGQLDKPADPFADPAVSNVALSQYWIAAKTLLLNERRSGLIIMLVGAFLTLGMPVVHVMAPGGIFHGAIARSSPAFLFVWTLHAMGVIGMFSFILSVRGLWGLRRGQPR